MLAVLYSMPHILTNGQTAHNTVANTKSNNCGKKNLKTALTVFSMGLAQTPYYF